MGRGDENENPFLAAADSTAEIELGSLPVQTFETFSTMKRRSAHVPTTWLWLCVFGIIQLIIAVISITALVSARKTSNQMREPTHAFVKRLGFGSCTQSGEWTDSVEHVWTKGVIPEKPDAWMWLGDMAYLDVSVMDCKQDRNSEHPDCYCKPTYMQHMPYQCYAGDRDNALKKMRSMLNSKGYGAFLEYMCPGSLLQNQFPPNGRDPSVCPRLITGVYDDHDSGWNNGNRRLPAKDAMKQVFLDAIGEPRDSVRRSSSRGIYDWMTLNSRTPERSIDVIMLDERYDRTPLPCHLQRDYCTGDMDDVKQALCQDGLGTSQTNASDAGSCCKRDDDIALGWCKNNADDPRFASACDPTTPEFGTTNWAVDLESGELMEADMRDWRQGEEPSCFCEMLGPEQRKWLKPVLEHATAPVQLILSGSVLLASPGITQKSGMTCSGDDWDCYRPAQVNLLHQIAASHGCTIVLTGDYHVADIKIVDPSKHSAGYAALYQTRKLKKPVYQIMASGMTTVTAKGLNTSCGEVCCGWNNDQVDLRPGGNCAVFGGPNFGMLDFDWGARRLTMSIYRGDGGGIAKGANGAILQLSISLDTCMPV